jgi:hypothetical protein
MPRLTLCPHCETPTGLPPESSDTTTIECSGCGRSFAVAQAAASLAQLMQRSGPQTATNDAERMTLEDLLGKSEALPPNRPTPAGKTTVSGAGNSTVELPISDPPSAANYDEVGSADSPLEFDGPRDFAASGAAADDLYSETADDHDADRDYSPGDAPNLDFPAVDADDESTASVATISTRRRRQRRFSPTRAVLMYLSSVAVAGVLGYFAVMWIQHFRGHPTVDPINLAWLYPSSVVPPGVQATADLEGKSSSANAPSATEPSAAEQLAAAASRAAARRQNPDNRVEMANYNEPISSPAAPERFASDEATRLPPDGSFQLPGAPSYSSADLARATEVAKGAMPALLNGRLSDAALRRDKALSYATICRLAHVLTFYDAEGADYDMSLKLEAQEQVFKRMMLDPWNRQDIGEIAGFWLDSPNRQVGIFFAGQLGRARATGPVFEYRVTLDDGRQIPVVRRKRFAETRFAGADAVGVIGEVIDQPAARIAGYDGDAEWVVWAENVVPIVTPEHMKVETPTDDPLGGFDLEPLPELDVN